MSNAERISEHWQSLSTTEQTRYQPMTRLLLFALMIAGVSRAEDQPFGFYQGFPEARMEECIKSVNDYNGALVCSTKRTPKSDQRFTEYQLTYTEKAGLCSITARRQFDLREGTTALRELYTAIEQPYLIEYGKPKVSFWDMSTGFWDDPSSVLKRFKSGRGPIGDASWSRHNGNEMPGAVRGISLFVQAESPETVSLRLGYSFSNHWQCDRPEVRPDAPFIELSTADLGMDMFGNGTVRFIQTEISPYVRLVETLNVRPIFPPRSLGGVVITDPELMTMLGRCTVMRLESTLGKPYAYVPNGRLRGTYVAFLPADETQSSFESRGTGRLQAATETDTKKLRSTCAAIASIKK